MSDETIGRLAQDAVNASKINLREIVDQEKDIRFSESLCHRLRDSVIDFLYVILCEEDEDDELHDRLLQVAGSYGLNVKEAEEIIAKAAMDEARRLIGEDGVVCSRCGDDLNEGLGRRVRELWVDWARRQPNPQPSWLVPWDELSVAGKEAAIATGRGMFIEFKKLEAEGVGCVTCRQRVECLNCGNPMAVNYNPNAGKPSHLMTEGAGYGCVGCLEIKALDRYAKLMEIRNMLREAKAINDGEEIVDAVARLLNKTGSG